MSFRRETDVSDVSLLSSHSTHLLWTLASQYCVAAAWYAQTVARFIVSIIASAHCWDRPSYIHKIKNCQLSARYYSISMLASHSYSSNYPFVTYLSAFLHTLSDTMQNLEICTFSLSKSLSCDWSILALNFPGKIISESLCFYHLNLCHNLVCADSLPTDITTYQLKQIRSS